MHIKSPATYNSLYWRVAQKKPLITKKTSGVAKNYNGDPVTKKETPLLSD